jgi:hypothetical protein
VGRRPGGGKIFCDMGWTDCIHGSVRLLIRVVSRLIGSFFLPISGQAREAFLEAESEGMKPRILSTSDYDEAQAFSESTYWI